MAKGSSTLLFRCIRCLAEAGAACELSDCELVQQFAEKRDEAAFTALVRRHGAMVLGVCRRVLDHEQDAEDVFQAVFLVLSRKAGSLRSKEAVGPWLFGVARRLALRARQQGRNQRERKGRVGARPPEDVLGELTVREAQIILDEELAALPERDRGPLVLCYLQGLTRDEAAQRLGCPLGTLKSRLERAREALQKRLTRRGVTLNAVLGTHLLTGTSAFAMPTAVVTAMVQPGVAFAGGSASGSVVSLKAAALAEWALQSTLVSKIKIAAACFFTTAACIGLSLSALFGSRPTLEEQANHDVAQRLDRTRPDQLQVPQSKEGAFENAVKPQAGNQENGAAPAMPDAPRMPRRFLDLQPHATAKLSDDFAYERNNLIAVPLGEQTLCGVKFQISEGLILLGWDGKPAPKKVEGIPVDTKFTTLHVLHATHWAAKEKDAIVGYYSLNYEDKGQEIIPIVFGKDIGNWWYRQEDKLPTHAKIAWKGENPAAAATGQSKIRLYLANWRNPEPARRVVSIDFTSTRPDVAPFCLAMTIEE